MKQMCEIEGTLIRAVFSFITLSSKEGSYSSRALGQTLATPRHGGQLQTQRSPQTSPCNVIVADERKAHVHASFNAQDSKSIHVDNKPNGFCCLCGWTNQKPSSQASPNLPFNERCGNANPSSMQTPLRCIPLFVERSSSRVPHPTSVEVVKIPLPCSRTLSKFSIQGRDNANPSFLQLGFFEYCPSSECQDDKSLFSLQIFK